MYEFPHDIDRDFYEHHQDGIENAVFHFHYAFREGVERVLKRDDNGVAISVTRDGYFFAIERVTLARYDQPEVDVIIYTIMDLEQHMGRSIDIVLGEPFDSVIDKKGSYLPNVMTRYCTTEMKIRPLFRHWSSTCEAPVEMQIGFRANEQRRAHNMEKKVNDDGLLEFKDIVGKWPNGRNRWKTTAWQKPSFPLIRDGIFKDVIQDFWRDKPVRFAPLNNCVGCFHRNPILLRQMFDDHPEKMAWFEAQEQRSKKGQWKKEMSYTKIKNHRLQLEIDPADWESDCDSGHCGL